MTDAVDPEPDATPLGYLSAAERDAVVAALREGRPLDERYKALLFPAGRDGELSYADKATRGEILSGVMAVPLQVQKRIGEPGPDWTNKLIFGDNLQVLKTLLELKERGDLRNADGSRGIRLCYIDPPFATKREFRGRRGALAYRDKVAGAEFVEYLRKRLVFIHELLTDDGTLYLHLDVNKVHYMKVVLDEIFGANNLVGEVVWKRTFGHGDSQRWAPVHETILVYGKTSDYIWNTPRASHDESYGDRKYTHDDGDGRGKYQRTAIDSPNPRPNLKYVWQGYLPPEKGWRYSKATMDELDADGRIYKPEDRMMRPRLKRYWDENEGRVVDDVWLDVAPVNSQATDRVGYPTQKPMALLERIIAASSNEGDLVLDCFSGSGTTAVAATALARRWVAVDSGKLALYTTQRRLLALNGSGHSVEVSQAGLYDNQLLEALPYADFASFTLDLFGCRATTFKIGGVPMAGRRKGDPVHVFPFAATAGDLDAGYVETLHARVGEKVGRTVYIIVPESRCDAGLFEDLLRHGKTTYFILRVPYSVIEALHDRAFQSIGQPASLAQVNDAVNAYGFDFMEPPDARLNVKRTGKRVRITVDAFHRGGLDPDDAPGLDDAGRSDLAMVLVDPAYNGESFMLNEHLFGEALRHAGWSFDVTAESGLTIMLIFVDIYGNELRTTVDVPEKAKARNNSKQRVSA